MEQITHTSSSIVDNLQRCGHVLKSVLAPHYAEFGLTDIRFSVLNIITRTPNRQCTQSELAKALEQSESSVSTLVERMRTDGWLYRLTSSTDRRKRVLMLSEKGRETLEKISACHEERLNQLFGQFNWPQQQQLGGLLRNLLEQLTKAQKESDSLLTPSWMQPSERRVA